MNRYDKVVRNIGIVVLILMIGSSVVLGSDNVDEGSSNGSNGTKVFEGVPLQKGTTADSGELSVDESFILTISEESGQLIKNFTAKLSWSDESSQPGRPTARRYENQPDSFSLQVVPPDGNSSKEQGQNAIGDPGNLEITKTFDEEYLVQMMDEGRVGMSEWTVTVTLESSGEWVPQIGLGFLNIEDGVNEFSLSVEFEYYDFEPEEEAE